MDKTKFPLCFSYFDNPLHSEVRRSTEENISCNFSFLDFNRSRCCININLSVLRRFVSGLHPHQSGGPMPNPALYAAPPVSLSPGQPPPQQLLPPPFYPPPGVMTFGNTNYPYPAGATLPPMYPNPQVSLLNLNKCSLYPVTHSSSTIVSLTGFLRLSPGTVTGLRRCDVLRHDTAASSAQTLPAPTLLSSRYSQTSPS